MDSSVADSIATRQVPESLNPQSFRVWLQQSSLLSFWLLSGRRPYTENLPKTPCPLFSLNGKETGGRQERDSVTSLPFHCCSASEEPCGSSWWERFLRFVPGPALCGPASHALYPRACQENASPWAQAGAGREPLPVRCSSTSLCARICHNFTKSRNMSRLHPFIHPLIQHSFIYQPGFRWRRLLVIMG